VEKINRQRAAIAAAAAADAAGAEHFATNGLSTARNVSILIRQIS